MPSPSVISRRSQRPLRDDRRDERARRAPPGAPAISASAPSTRPNGASCRTRSSAARPSPRRWTSCATETSCAASRLRRVREHARPVGDVEVDVERRAPARSGRAASSSRQHASFWRKPVPAVPTTLTRSATTADAVSIPPAPGPSSVISRIASPWSITALNAPSTAASGCERSTNAGWTRTSTAPSDERRDARRAARPSRARRPRRRAPARSR